MTTTTHLTEALRNATETPLRALTVQQPWAWAILHGGKDVENRTQAWAHRGPLLIHAGQRWSERGGESPLVTAAAWEVGGDVRPTAQHYGPDFVLPGPEWPTGAILGVAQLVDVHAANPGCCDSPWAETSYDEHGGKTRRDVAHLVLEDPRPLAEPVPCRGMLGLWTPPLDVLAQIAEVGA